MHVDADAYDSKGDGAAFSARLDQNAARFTRADEKIVGPAQVNSKAGDGANCIGGGEAGGQRQQRQTGGGDLRAQQDAYVKAFTGVRAPDVIAAPASGQLLIGKVDRAVRCGLAGAIQCVCVCGIGYRRKVELAGKDGARERGVQCRKIEHGLDHGVHGGLTHSAAMLIEISAALAEWVRAPTLMKSTPVSA